MDHHHSCSSFYRKTPFWLSAHLHPILSFLSHQMVQIFKHRLPPTSFYSFPMILSGAPSKFSLSLPYQCCNTHHTWRKLPGSFCWQLTLSKDYQNNLSIEQSQGELAHCCRGEHQLYLLCFTYPCIRLLGVPSKYLFPFGICAQVVKGGMDQDWREFGI